MLIDTSGIAPTIAKTEEKKKMLSVTEDSGQTIVEINSSSLSIMLTCWRKVKLALLRGLATKEGSPALVFGNAIHKALEVFYQAERKEREWKPSFREAMSLIPHGEEITENSPLVLRCAQAFVNEGEALRPLPAGDKRSLEAGLWSLSHYFEKHIDDPYVCLRDESGPYVEKDISFTLYEDSELKIIYFGRIDVILQNENTGEIFVTDHKTSSVVGPDFYNRLKPNHQYTGYLLGARESLDLKTDKFMVNCIQVKPKPKTARGSAPDFPRQVTVRTEEDYQEFRNTVQAAVREFLLRKEKGLFTPGDVNSCSMYRGCGFLDVCSAPNSLKENIIESKFVENSYA